MTRFVALLRGINVGGRTLKMADLRDLLTTTKATDVTTYIQSGNVVLSHPSRTSATVADEIEERIRDATGMDVPVMARTAAEWEAVIDANPFPDAGGTALHVVFLSTPPAADALDHLDLDSFAPEACAVVGRELYLHLPAGMGRATLPVELGKRKGPMAVGTARNWNTVLKLREMLAAG